MDKVIKSADQEAEKIIEWAEKQEGMSSFSDLRGCRVYGVF